MAVKGSGRGAWWCARGGGDITASIKESVARREENSSRGREQTIEGRGLKDMGMLLIEKKNLYYNLCQNFICEGKTKNILREE